jgi:hypothetical protein
MTKTSLDKLMEERAEVLPTRDELSVFDCGGSRWVYGNYHNDCDYNRHCDFDRHCDGRFEGRYDGRYDGRFDGYNNCDGRFDHRW